MTQTGSPSANPRNPGARSVASERATDAASPTVFSLAAQLVTHTESDDLARGS